MAAKALSFDVGDYVVYPKHGVGRVVELQSQEIAGTQARALCAALREGADDAPRSDQQGRMRRHAQAVVRQDAAARRSTTLKGKPKVKRTMWSRRAQEYEAKINSGDLVSIAEVIRDLFRADDQPEQSYSERQIFEAASAASRASWRRWKRSTSRPRRRRSWRSCAAEPFDRVTNEGGLATGRPFHFRAAARKISA